MWNPPQKNIKEGACDNDRRFEQLGKHLLWEEGLFGVALLLVLLCGCRERKKMGKIKMFDDRKKKIMR